MIKRLSKMPWNTLQPDSKQYNYEYFQSSNVCRICWSTNATREITEDSENELKSSLYDKIVCCLDIDITKYSNINKICCDCVEEIDKFYDFKIFCRDANARLQQILETERENDIEIKIEKFDVFNLSSPISSEVSLDNSFDEVDLEPVVIKKIKTKNGIERSKNKQPHTKEIKSSEIVSKGKTKKSYTIKIQKKISKTTNPLAFCRACHLDCGSEENFADHNAVYHGIEENGTVFKCFGCEKRFKTKKTRTSHEINFCKGVKDGYKCRFCDRFFPKRNLYYNHMRYHLHNRKRDLPKDIFKCRKCFSRFETNECLTKHMEVHFTMKKNYVCETCGRVFTRRDYLYKHTLMHAGVKRHSCPHCDFKATQRSSLTMHIRKHTGERPYSCDLCPQQCVSSSNLRAHRRRHLDIKEYECTICNKKFGYKISLDEHISSTHERTELHSCEQCGATYSRIRGLRRHLAAKHGKQNKQDAKEKSTEVLDENTQIGQEDHALIKNVQYELKEGDLLLIKNQDCEVFMV